MRLMIGIKDREGKIIEEVESPELDDMMEKEEQFDLMSDLETLMLHLIQIELAARQALQRRKDLIKE